MRYFYLPVRDASIYSNVPRRNTGLDEILEVGKMNSGSAIARALLDFDVTALSAVPGNAEYDLVLYVANAKDLWVQQSLHFAPVSQSWNEGTGYYYQDVVQFNDGVTWNQRVSGSSWAITGSAYSTPILSASAANPFTQMTIDVTSFVRAWISGSYPATGIVVKFPDADETNLSNKGNVKFFSKDTHTIYRPVLVAKWDDATYATGSLSAAPAAELSIIPIVKAVVKTDEMVRIDLAVRERYPQKTFANQFTLYNGDNYLPTSSYYSIVDVQSNVEIVPFSDQSKISCSPSGSFFRFKVQNMYPLRFYQVRIKVDRGSGDVEFYDCKPFFKVVQ
jgi:hypothetical protein